MEQTTLNAMDNFERLPRISYVMLRILELCQQDDTDRDELVGLISSDPMLTARLMKLLSSAWINLNKDIHSIESALLYLGMAEIKNVVLSMALLNAFDTTPFSSHFNFDLFWSHSFKTALLAQTLAGECGNIDPNEAYLAGLMHDIGKLVLMANYPERYLTLLNESDDDQALTRLERDQFDMTHGEVGSWLCKRWGLSPMISDAVLYVEEPLERVAHAAFPLVKLIFVANWLDESKEPEGGGSTSIGKLIDIDGETLRTSMERSDQSFLTMAETLGIGFPERDLHCPITPRSLCAGSKSNADEIKEKLFDEALQSKVKEHALLSGTLEALLHAGDLSAILKALEMGIKVLFDAPEVIFFLVDTSGKLLTGVGDQDKRYGRVMNTIAISITSGESQLVKSLDQNTMLGNRSIQGNARAGSLSMSDEQILRILGTEEMFTLPMTLPEKSVGVMVVGVNGKQVPALIKHSGTLSILARLAATTIDRHRYRSTQPFLVQSERAGAASDAMGKVIHEINNPLVIISSYLKILTMKLPDMHPARNEIAVIEDEIGRIGDLVKSLSPFAEPPNREFEWIDMKTLFGGLIDMMKTSILSPKGIEANLVVAPRFPKVKTDGNALKQILINLVKNAAEAMTSEGTIQIRLRPLPGSQKVVIDEMKKRAGAVELTVKDNGPGIPEDVMNRLFEPYHRSTRKEVSGLGLSIVSTLVKRINGTISCRSRKNRGTEFIIQLPVISSHSLRPST